MLVGKDLPALVRFDREYPYGDKADAFKLMAAEVAKAGAPLLVGSVGVSTWGDRMNNDIVVAEGFIAAEKELGYDDMDSLFPKFRFYPAKGGKTVDFTGEVTADGLMQFLKDTAKIYFALPGCVKALDEIAMKFKGAASLENAKKAVAELGELEKEKAAYYLKAMEKEIAKPGHIVKEKARLEGANSAIDSVWLAHSTLDMEALDVVPIFLQQRHQEVYGHQRILPHFVRGHVHISDGNTHAKHLLQLKFYLAPNLSDLVLKVVTVLDQSRELASLVQAWSQKPWDLWDQHLGGDESIK